MLQEINSVDAKLVIGNIDKEAMILEAEKQIMKVFSVFVVFLLATRMSSR